MRQLLHVLRARLAGLLRRGHLDVDFREELRTHEAMLTEDLERRGVARDEARRRARIVLGNPTALAQEHRERRTWRLLADVGADVRVALRQFRRRPGFTLIAMLTMALGIGVNTTVFSALNAVALRPLPIAGADRAVRVERWAQSGLRGASQFVYSYAEYAWLHDHLDVMADLVAISLPAPVNSRASQELAATATAELSSATRRRRRRRSRLGGTAMVTRDAHPEKSGRHRGVCWVCRESHSHAHQRLESGEPPKLNVQIGVEAALESAPQNRASDLRDLTKTGITQRSQCCNYESS